MFESLSRLGKALADLLYRKGARAIGRVQFLRFADQQKFKTPVGLVMKDLRQFAYFGRFSQRSPVFHLDHFRFAIFAHDKVGEEARQEFQWTVLLYLIAFAAVLCRLFFNEVPLNEFLRL